MHDTDLEEIYGEKTRLIVNTNESTDAYDLGRPGPYHNPLRYTQMGGYFSSPNATL